MRQALSVGLVVLMMTQLCPASFVADDVSSQIARIPAGAEMEIHLKDKQVLHGTRGEASSSGFTLVNPAAGDRQIAFTDVSSVKQLTRKSHKTRNILIITGVAVVVVATVLAIHIKNCPLGCGGY